jgi:hypothetical protein
MSVFLLHQVLVEVGHLANRLDAGSRRGIDLFAMGPRPTWKGTANDADLVIRSLVFSDPGSRFRKLRLELPYALVELRHIGVQSACPPALTGEGDCERCCRTAAHHSQLAQLTVLRAQSSQLLAQKVKHGGIRRGDPNGRPIRQIDLRVRG